MKTIYFISNHGKFEIELFLRSLAIIIYRYGKTPRGYEKSFGITLFSLTCYLPYIDKYVDHTRVCFCIPFILDFYFDLG